MKNWLVLVSILLMAFAGCKSKDGDEPVPAVTTGKVVFVFTNEVDGVALSLGSLNYTNEAGNVYSVDQLKYYISNIVFIKDDGTEFKAPNYELIDEEKLESKYFVVNHVPFGNYSSLRFYVGVDSSRSTAGVQVGDLDPINGMLWDWQTGYICFKHEGEFIDSTGTTDYLTFHLGKVKGMITEELNINFSFNEPVKTFKMTFNLNEVYRSPNIMDFNGENIHQSTGPNENDWVQMMKENFDGAFEVTSIE